MWKFDLKEYKEIKKKADEAGLSMGFDWQEFLKRKKEPVKELTVKIFNEAINSVINKTKKNQD